MQCVCCDVHLHACDILRHSCTNSMNISTPCKQYIHSTARILRSPTTLLSCSLTFTGLHYNELHTNGHKWVLRSQQESTNTNVSFHPFRRNDAWALAKDVDLTVGDVNCSIQFNDRSPFLKILRRVQPSQSVQHKKLCPYPGKQNTEYKCTQSYRIHSCMEMFQG